MEGDCPFLLSLQRPCLRNRRGVVWGSSGGTAGVKGSCLEWEVLRAAAGRKGSPQLCPRQVPHRGLGQEGPWQVLHTDAPQPRSERCLRACRWRGTSLRVEWRHTGDARSPGLWAEAAFLPQPQAPSSKCARPVRLVSKAGRDTSLVQAGHQIPAPRRCCFCIV